jgi:ABC-2 type transport system permease protein
MSTPTTAPSAGATGRLAALGRAEFTLLLRNRSALAVALLLPALMIVTLRATSASTNSDTAYSAAGLAMSGGIAMSLLLVVHLNLVSAYVARREDLVLKRLRCGELRDLDILVGTALPAALLAVAQSAVLVAVGAILLDLEAPQQPVLLVTGVLLGVVLLTALAAVTSAVTRTVESAQLTTMPMLLLSTVGSGLFVPLESLPDGIATVCRLLPLSPVVELIRAGWLGHAGSGDIMMALVVGLAWTVGSVFAVRRWFRWEPRR